MLKLFQEDQVATAYERKRAEETRKRQEQKLIGAVAGTAVQLGKEAVIQRTLQTGTTRAVGAVRGLQAGSFLAGVVELVGNLSIAAWSFFTQKKQQKERARLTRKQTATQNNVDDILLTIEDTGFAIIEQHGVNPTSQEFEKILVDNLYKEIGYKGNCNATVWLPGNKPGPNRPVWFKVTQNGRKFEATPNLHTPPPNIQTYWYVQCRNIKDKWVNAYTDLLIEQGRIQELEQFQASLKKGSKILRVTFGIMFLVIGVLFIVNLRRIKV